MTDDKLPARSSEWQKLKEVGLPPPTWPDPPVVAYDPFVSDHDEDSGVDVRRLVAGIVRFKWVVALTTILGAVGGGIAWSLVDLEYVAEASLWLEAATGGQPQSQGLDFPRFSGQVSV